MAPPIRPRNPDSAPKAVREAMAARRAQQRKKWVGRGLAATAIAGAIAIPVGIAIHRDNPRTWEKENPAMVQAAMTRNFHEYDRQAFRTVPALKGSAPVVLKHWNAITNIAKTHYNTLAVVDTLSRIDPKDISGSKTLSDWASPGNPRMARRSDVIERAMNAPGGVAAINDLHKLNSSDIERGRQILYGHGSENWKYGALRSGTQELPMEYVVEKKDAPFKQLDRESQILKAKSRK